MKYNFSPIIEQRVQVKLNGIDSKQWIQGVPAAAEACQELSVRACIELYIKTCVEHTSDPKRDEVKAFLLGMGFAMDVVAIELLTGPFAVFLHGDGNGLQDAQKVATMQVRIARCSTQYSWYAGRIGQTLTVRPIPMPPGRPGNWTLEVYPVPASGQLTIPRADVDILSF